MEKVVTLVVSGEKSLMKWQLFSDITAQYYRCSWKDFAPCSKMGILGKWPKDLKFIINFEPLDHSSLINTGE